MGKSDLALLTYRERKEYELKKVQQRTAAIIAFAIVVTVVSGLLGLATVLVDQNRAGGAAFLLAINAIVSILCVLVIRALLQQRILTIPWLTAAVSPTVVAAVWLF